MVDQSAVGRSFTPVTARVEPGRLRYFVNTIGERNPIYRDAQVAGTEGYSAIPAPPSVTSSTMRGVTLDDCFPYALISEFSQMVLMSRGKPREKL